MWIVELMANQITALYGQLVLSLGMLDKPLGSKNISGRLPFGPLSKKKRHPPLTATNENVLVR